jgi:hypothetical protein
MQRLADATGLIGGIDQLAEAHAQQLLPLLTADVAKWGSGSHSLLTFTSLMQTAGAGTLSTLLPQIAQVRFHDIVADRAYPQKLTCNTHLPASTLHQTFVEPQSGHDQPTVFVSLYCPAQVLQPVLSDHDREPALRLSLLELLDRLLEGPSTAGVFVGSSSNAELTLHTLLMPPLVWRAGKVSTSSG